MAKKKFKDTKFNAFLNKAKDHLPELAEIATDAITMNWSGAVQGVGDLIRDNKDKNEATKQLHAEYESSRRSFLLEEFSLESEDRKSARLMYSADSIAQKAIALVFTVAYFGVTFVLLNHFFGTNEKLEDYELGFLSTLFGAMSSKVNTIIDFFFGGSVRKD
jgi:hypothetical protein